MWFLIFVGVFVNAMNLITCLCLSIIQAEMNHKKSWCWFKVVACFRNLSFSFLTHMRVSFALTHWSLHSLCLLNPVCSNILSVVSWLEDVCSASVPGTFIINSMGKTDYCLRISHRLFLKYMSEFKVLTVNFAYIWIIVNFEREKLHQF